MRNPKYDTDDRVSRLVEISRRKNHRANRICGYRVNQGDDVRHLGRPWCDL